MRYEVTFTELILADGKRIPIHMSRNGQLRMVFYELLPPDGPGAAVIAEKVEASLEGIQSAAAGNVKLDAEGGVEAGYSGTISQSNMPMRANAQAKTD